MNVRDNTAAPPTAESSGSPNLPVQRHSLWGPETARSLHFFAIGEQRMPMPLIHAMAWIKWGAAQAHEALGLLDAPRARWIAQAALQVAQGKLDDQFPLSVWQTGSGTHSHMNVNEVIARLASSMRRAQRLPVVTIDAHDHVNKGQSSNDVFPSAMHIAVALATRDQLLPALHLLRSHLALQAHAWRSAMKVGRTHMQDAVPIALGDEFAAHAAQLSLCEGSLCHSLEAIHAIALGGTAVGNGLGSHPELAQRVVGHLNERLHLPLRLATNRLAATAGQEAMVAWHSSLRMLAIALMKIAGDLRLMGSGPRAGLGELQLPGNEPGSSMMPGKVNPSQIEALCMVCAQVMGHDMAIGIAACQGQLELNTYKPLIAFNALDSARLLSDAMDSFARHCVAGLKADLPHMAHVLEQSLCDVMALVPHLGHEEAARIARHAQTEGVSLKEAAWAVADVEAALFDTWVLATRDGHTALRTPVAKAESANDSAPAALESMPGLLGAR